MPSLVLWRKLTKTDFEAINGEAAPSGTGGGAMHIALGVDNPDTFPIDSFLQTGGSSNITIDTEAHGDEFGASQLTFDGNPDRRGGEWRINDQYTHRHPAWQTANGFPDDYDSDDPPFIFVLRVAGKFHARFLRYSDLPAVAPDIWGEISGSANRNKGIIPLTVSIINELNVPTPQRLVPMLEEIAFGIEDNDEDAFDPENLEDGRVRTLTEIVQRQGQQSFRRRLLEAYNERCAFTGCSTIFVLEAAHITPYLGPETNDVSNGLLLRSDIHTLFDLGLLSVDPQTYEIKVSSKLADTDYASLDGRQIQLPEVAEDRPSAPALESHGEIFDA